MGYIRMKTETLRKNQKKMVEIKNTITEMKKAFSGFISRLDMVKERISEFEDKSIEASQIEMKRKIREHSRMVG